MFRQKHDALKDAGAVTAFVVKDGHVAADRLSLDKLGLTQGLTARGYIYTDRPAYRPGHTVQIAGSSAMSLMGLMPFRMARNTKSR